jgi:lactoylglutathione lyase
MTGPSSARWTHVALPAADLDASIAWYESFTPLRVVHRRSDEAGQSCWLAHPEPAEHPFVLVLVDFNAVHGRRQPLLAPFAHLGMELPSRDHLDDVADRARAAGCLQSEPQDLPDPIGYVCMVNDPDGNVIEFSHNQRVYETFREQFGDR